MKMKKLNIW